VADYPSHVNANIAAWTEWSGDYLAPGRKSWASPSMSWGIWGIPESEVGAFGDLTAMNGKDTIELGCGTAYFSAWMAKHGARPVGIDVTPAQLASARAFQAEFGIEFPLLEGSAEAVPLPDASFDIAFSEYGASIWCRPERWLAEARRLLRPGGRLVFLRNSTVAQLCYPQTGPAGRELLNPQFGLSEVSYPEGGVEFHPPHGEMIRLLRRLGFTIEDLIELRAPENGSTRYDFMTLDWARNWPCEEIWIATSH